MKLSIKHIAVSLLLLYGCGKKAADTPLPQTEAPAPTVPSAPNVGFDIVNTFPHDHEAFTEGLQYYNGFLYESTGLNEHSHLRKLDLKTGKTLQNFDLDKQYFGEGITILNSKIYQLTYTSHIGFIYDLKTFKKLGSWNYQGEGWALTNDGTNIIMSNGSSNILYLDPNSLAIIKTIQVTDGGLPVERLNELEYIRGEIWANIWQIDRIARIDPSSGKVIAWLDCANLITPEEQQHADVLNGIAYDQQNDRVFITGKLWTKIFEIKLKSKPTVAQ